MPRYRLERTEFVVEGYLKEITVGGISLVLAGGASGPRVIEATCPHAGGRMAAGKVVGDRVRCPVHGYMFDLRTGYCPRSSREGFRALAVMDVADVDGDLWVELADGLGRPGELSTNLPDSRPNLRAG